MLLCCSPTLTHTHTHTQHHVGFIFLSPQKCVQRPLRNNLALLHGHFEKHPLHTARPMTIWLGTCSTNGPPPRRVLGSNSGLRWSTPRRASLRTLGMKLWRKIRPIVRRGPGDDCFCMACSSPPLTPRCCCHSTAPCSSCRSIAPYYCSPLHPAVVAEAQHPVAAVKAPLPAAAISAQHPVVLAMAATIERCVLVVAAGCRAVAAAVGCRYGNSCRAPRAGGGGTVL